MRVPDRVVSTIDWPNLKDVDVLVEVLTSQVLLKL